MGAGWARCGYWLPTTNSTRRFSKAERAADEAVEALGVAMARVVAALDGLLPDTCILCDQAISHTRGGLCSYCHAALAFNTPSCQTCALPLTSSTAERCPSCMLGPFLTGRAVAPLLHDATTSGLVQRLKFHHGMREARCLSAIICETVTATYADAPLPEVLVPVPLAYWNEVRRGYNQSFELARRIGKALGIAVDPSAFARRPGPRQRGQSRRARTRLQSSAFRQKARIPAHHVAIVDDVMTTGSTVRAFAAALGEAGVGRVDAWCATRAVLG